MRKSSACTTERGNPHEERETRGRDRGRPNFGGGCGRGRRPGVSWANPLPTPEGDYLEEADLQELLDNPYTFVQEFLPYLHYSPEEGVYRFPMTVEGESCWLQVEGAEDLEAPTLIQLETQEGEVLRTYEMAPLPPEG